MRLRGVWIIWNNGVTVRFEKCSHTLYRYHIAKKDLRLINLYSYRDNYPRKIIETPHEYFSNKLI